jgi:hypothetical protein
MSEAFPASPEHARTPESGHEHAEASKTKHAHEKAAERAEKPSDIEKIRHSVEQAARKSEMPHLHQDEPKGSPIGIDKAVKLQALNRTLKNLRQHLSPSERSLSRVVHQPVVDAASELGSKTVARPSGILGGGICAFVGSLLFLYLAKHNGFRYNYLLFLIFFVGGFAVGLVIEILFSLLRRIKQHS